MSCEGGKFAEDYDACFIGVKPLAHMILWDISSLPPALCGLYHVTGPAHNMFITDERLGTNTNK